MSDWPETPEGAPPAALHLPASKPAVQMFALADYATVDKDNKLTVVGAGIAEVRVATPPGTVTQLALGVVLAFPPLIIRDPHELVIRAIRPDDAPQGGQVLARGKLHLSFRPGVPPAMSGLAAFALPLNGLQVDPPTTISFHLIVDGEDLAICEANFQPLQFTLRPA